MPLREFLRGGYQKIYEPTIIMKRGYPEFTVWPGVRAPNTSPSSNAGDSIPPGPPGPSPNGG